MIFSSIEFLLCFLPLFLLLYGVTPKSMKNGILFLASLIFYAFGEPVYLFLLLVSVLVNYFLGLHLARGARLKGKDKKQKKSKLVRKRKILLVMAVAGNIGVLAAFKFGISGDELPIGISFYTFQILSYLIDVYRGEEKKETSILRLATYITMFPQLLTGPIINYGEVREELYNREFAAKNIQDGLKVFTVGLVCKVLLADRLGLLWQEVQVTGFESISTPLAWIAAIAYSMKLYFDFSGYSLMAVGLGQMLGFTLPANFDHPYMAGSVRAFYRRWHITLGRWFRRYVYIPLGGSRKGRWRTACNLLCVWLLTALWHGKSYNFLIWGLFLWVLIVMERILERSGAGKFFSHGILRVLPHLYLWLVIPISWMCFAITDIFQLGTYLGRMFGITEGIRVNADDWKKALMSYGSLLVAGGFACTPILQKIFQRWKDNFFGMILLIVLFWVCVWRLQIEGQNPFMYLNF